MNAYMVSLYNPLVAEFQDALGIDADFITHWALSPISPAMVKNGARHGENVLGLERVRYSGLRPFQLFRPCCSDPSLVGYSRRVHVWFIVRTGLGG